MKRVAFSLELEDNEKNLIEVILGHLAKAEDGNDDEVAAQFRSMINKVKDEDPMTVIDWNTIGALLQEKETIEYPIQPYDEDEVAESAVAKIDEAVDGIPEHLTE